MIETAEDMDIAVVEVDEPEMTVSAKLIEKLNADLRAAARLLTRAEVRHLVRLYYQIQGTRMAAGSQARHDDQPSSLTNHMCDQLRIVEGQTRYALSKFAENDPMARMSMCIYGIGPVLASGLLSHIDIEKAPYFSHVRSFAGLYRKPWEKGEKRPWNAELRMLCWKIGDSFRKFSRRDECHYGHAYRERKVLLEERNANGRYAATAATSLETRKFRDKGVIEVYESGRLPQGRIEAWARQHAVELYLSHWHECATWLRYNRMPAKPWAHAHDTVEHDGRSYVSPQDMGWPEFGDEEMRERWRSEVNVKKRID